MLQILEISDFDQMYHLMKTSFPQDEYRPYAAQKALFDESAYRVYAHYDDTHTLLAILAVWEFDRFAFLEHFAVEPNRRNSGLGSRLLQELASLLNKPLCLEAELPDSELAQRRIGFYQRNGFCQNPYPYIQPALAADQHPIPLCIMTFPAPISQQEFVNLQDTLYQKVYKVK